MEPTFPELYRRALSDLNDADAYNATVGLAHEPVWRLAHARLQDEAAADGILEQTLEVWVRKRPPNFTAQKPLRVWMIRVALNLLKRHHHTLKVRREEPLEEDRTPCSAGYEPVDCLIVKENRASVRAALQRLSHPEAAILELWSQELSYTEIADILDIPLTAVGCRVSRALTRLHAVLQHVDPSLAAEYPRGGSNRRPGETRHDQSRTCPINSIQEDHK